MPFKNLLKSPIFMRSFVLQKNFVLQKGNFQEIIDGRTTAEFFYLFKVCLHLRLYIYCRYINRIKNC